MSLTSKVRLSYSLLYDRLADFLRDTTDNANIQDYFWEVFDKLVQDNIHFSEKVMDCFTTRKYILRTSIPYLIIPYYPYYSML